MHTRSTIALAAVCGLLAPTLLPSFAFAEDVPAGVTIPAAIQSEVAGDEGAVVNYKVTVDVHDSAGKVIVPAGSTGTGHVVQYRPSAGFGGPGKTEVSLDQIVTPDGAKLSVKSKMTKYGHDTRFASIFFLGLWGYFAKGGSGKVGPNTTVAFVTQ